MHCALLSASHLLAGAPVSRYHPLSPCFQTLASLRPPLRSTRSPLCLPCLRRPAPASPFPASLPPLFLPLLPGLFTRASALHPLTRGVISGFSWGGLGWRVKWAQSVSWALRASRSYSRRILKVRPELYRCNLSKKKIKNKDNKKSGSAVLLRGTWRKQKLVLILPFCSLQKIPFPFSSRLRIFVLEDPVPLLEFWEIS